MIYKIILIGDIGVGKTSIILKLVNNKFYPEYNKTLDVDFYIYDIKSSINNTNITKLQIWDTAGELKYNSINESFFNNADAVIIVYDVNNYTSFNNVNTWHNIIKNNIKKNIINTIPIMLLGNITNSNIDNRKVLEKDAYEFALNNSMLFMECSASNQNRHKISDAFINLTRKIYVTKKHTN